MNSCVATELIRGSGGIFDVKVDGTLIFSKHSSGASPSLASSRRVGFNVKGFDYKVLEAYDTSGFSRVPTFDILVDVKHRLGYRLSLNHLAEHTLGAKNPPTASNPSKGSSRAAWI